MGHVHDQNAGIGPKVQVINPNVRLARPTHVSHLAVGSTDQLRILLRAAWGPWGGPGPLRSGGPVWLHPCDAQHVGRYQVRVAQGGGWKRISRNGLLRSIQKMLCVTIK